MPFPSRRFLGWWLIAVGTVCVAALGRLSRRIDEPVLTLAFGAAAVELLILLVAVALALALPGSVRARLGLRPSRLSPLEIALLAAGTLGLSHALDAGLVWSGLYRESELSTFASSMRGARGLPLALAALAIAALAPFAEELLCRGLVQRSLVPRLGRVAGVGIAALVFGTLHVEPIHATLAALLGVYLGVTALWGGSVLVPVVCHMVNNGFALAVAVTNGPSTSGTPLHVGVGLALAAGALVWVSHSAHSRLQPDSGSVDR